MAQTAWQIWRTNVFIFLPSKKLLKYTGSSLQNWRNTYFYYSTKHNKKLFKYPGSSLQIWRNKYFYCSTKHKKLLKYPGSSLQIWRNKYLSYSTKQKNSLNILGLLCRIESIELLQVLPDNQPNRTDWTFASFRKCEFSIFNYTVGKTGVFCSKENKNWKSHR